MSRKQLLVLLVIAVAVIGIWMIKNGPLQTATEHKKAAGENALEVIEQLDVEALKSHGLPIVIDFGADSCIPCKEMAPVLKALNAELQGKAIIKFVDVWKYKTLAEGYPIRAIPTQVFIGSDGKPYMPADPEAMQMSLYNDPNTGEHLFTIHEGGMSKEALMNVLSEMGVN